MSAPQSENGPGWPERLSALGADLKNAQTSLETRIDARFEAVARLEQAMHKRFETLGEKLEQIANAVGVKQAEKAGDDDEDRKRIKERLKEALDLHKRQQGLDKKDFMEYFFGICKADGRAGKTGSR
jgi:uncharacterized protein with von Willebrand factor type A (vWA) domain